MSCWPYLKRLGLVRVMSEVKMYRIKGRIPMGFLRTSFVKEIKALKPEHALEKIYSELGSRHKLKRKRIEILSIEEVSKEPLREI